MSEEIELKFEKNIKLRNGISIPQIGLGTSLRGNALQIINIVIDKRYRIFYCKN
jgi:hypothetical protein